MIRAAVAVSLYRGAVIIVGATMMGNDAWHRRQAIQIASQLPEDNEDALAILAYSKELVEVFLGTQRDDNLRGTARLLPFPVKAARARS